MRNKVNSMCFGEYTSRQKLYIKHIDIICREYVQSLHYIIMLLIEKCIDMITDIMVPKWLNLGHHMHMSKTRLPNHYSFQQSCNIKIWYQIISTYEKLHILMYVYNIYDQKCCNSRYFDLYVLEHWFINVLAVFQNTK